MGISDKDYGDALIKQKAYVAQQTAEKKIMQLELALERKKQQAGTGTVLISQGNTTTTFTGSGTYATGISVANPIAGVRPLTEQDIQGEAMQAPLSSLIDMWLMRWSGTWVSESDFQEDDFWRVALIRLLGANKVEKHHLADRIGAVYRIIE